jgi:thioredoxin reductase
MPRGMKLKSEGFASCIDDPDGSFPLSVFCKEQNLPYQDVGLPVPIETFVNYGSAFQQRFVANLEQRNVVALSAAPQGFELRLEDGERVLAKKIVVAVGVGRFAFIPPELDVLPPGRVSHSADHAEPGKMRGRDVIVVGAGASAVDLAALLHEAGARVRIVARRRSIDFHAPPERRPRRMWERIRAPRSGLGLGWRSLLCEDAPLVFRAMPEEFRLRVVQRHLGPAPGWFVREQVERHVPMLLGATVKSASANGHARLTVSTEAGEQVLETEHVIAATGYRVDMRRLPFLDAGLRGQIRMSDHTPVLTSRFETSVPGLFFIGPAAANCFGPLMRFACGNRFVSRRLAGYLA